MEDTLNVNTHNKLIEFVLSLGKYLTFWVDRQLYGIPIAEVVQIVGAQKIGSMPKYPIYAKGIINLRGSIIPVMDIRLCFQKSEAAYFN